jgi:hypothetical protein
MPQGDAAALGAAPQPSMNAIEARGIDRRQRRRQRGGADHQDRNADPRRRKPDAAGIKRQCQKQ